MLRPLLTSALALAAFIAASATWAAPTTLNKLFGKDKAKLLAGEILVSTHNVKGKAVPQARVRAVIDAPPEKIWKVVSNCNGYKKTMPRIAASKELGRKGPEIICTVTADLPFPFDDLTSKSRATHTIEKGKHYLREWTLIDGDYTYNSGKWELFAIEDGKRTLVLYQLLAVPKTSLPKWVLEVAQVRSLPNIIEGLREQMAE